MQNEERINVLETQVRTLKRIVCFVCCSYFLSIASGCCSMRCENCRYINPENPCNRCGQDPHPDPYPKTLGSIYTTKTLNVCSKCIEDKLRHYHYGKIRNRDNAVEKILSGSGGNGWVLHSESDCQSSE